MSVHSKVSTHPSQSKSFDFKYIVPMFPYPSGVLHMGHVRNYTISDVIATHYRRQGESVMYPIGWDAFGLPAENAAREKGIEPRIWTDSNIQEMKKQFEMLDCQFNWSQEIATHDPQYSAHGQALFLRMLKAGWIEQRTGEVDWDPIDQTVLAKEQVIQGRGWRSGAVVEKKTLKMWYAKTKTLSKRLDEEMHRVKWPKTVQNTQRAWIGWDENTKSAHLHDWCISRQRSWGTPIPIIECQDCGDVPALEEMLPLKNLSTYPTSAERAIQCPSCGKDALRSVETLDTFWDSAFYFYMYPKVKEGVCPTFEPHQPIAPIRGKPIQVDIYIGGREHTTMHLLYARWFAKVMKEMGEIVNEEPFQTLITQGMVCAPAFRTISTHAKQVPEWVSPKEVEKTSHGYQRKTDKVPIECVGSVKMSKSKKNGVNPNEVIEKYGPDAIRFAMMFAVPFSQDMSWGEEMAEVAQKHLTRLMKIAQEIGKVERVNAFANPPSNALALQAKIKEAFEKGEGVNALLGQALGVMREAYEAHQQGKTSEAHWMLCQVLDAMYPVIPKTALEAGVFMGWTPHPVAPPMVQSKRPITIQINGVTRGVIDRASSAEEAWERFRMEYPEVIQKYLPEGKQDEIWVEGRLLNVLSSVRKKPGIKI